MLGEIHIEIKGQLKFETLVNLLGGNVGAGLGEPLGPADRAAPLDTE